MFSLEQLPPEILICIVNYLKLSQLLTLTQTCRTFYSLIHQELNSGNIAVDVKIDGNEQVAQVLNRFPAIKRLHLKNITNLQGTVFILVPTLL